MLSLSCLLSLSCDCGGVSMAVSSSRMACSVLVVLAMRFFSMFSLRLLLGALPRFFGRGLDDGDDDDVVVDILRNTESVPLTRKKWFFL